MEYLIMVYLKNITYFEGVDLSPEFKFSWILRNHLATS